METVGQKLNQDLGIFVSSLMNSIWEVEEKALRPTLLDPEI